MLWVSFVYNMHRFLLKKANFRGARVFRRVGDCVKCDISVVLTRQIVLRLETNFKNQYIVVATVISVATVLFSIRLRHCVIFSMTTFNAMAACLLLWHCTDLKGHSGRFYFKNCSVKQC